MILSAPFQVWADGLSKKTTPSYEIDEARIGAQLRLRNSTAASRVRKSRYEERKEEPL